MPDPQTISRAFIAQATDSRPRNSLRSHPPEPFNPSWALVAIGLALVVVVGLVT